jgi:hypothetical protein
MVLPISNAKMKDQLSIKINKRKREKKNGGRNRANPGNKQQIMQEPKNES